MLLAILALAFLARAGGEPPPSPQLPLPEPPRLAPQYMDAVIAERVKQALQLQPQLESARAGAAARAAAAPPPWEPPAAAVANTSAEPYVDLSPHPGGVTPQAAGGLAPRPDPFSVNFAGSQ
jgi:hypothetical protein